jgi:UDP-glucose 4-epimerase
VYGDGTQTRSFSDVRDVVNSLQMLADNSVSHGEIVNVGNDSEISIHNLAKLIRDKSGSNSEIKFVPYKEAYETDLTDIKQRRPNLSKFQTMTGYTNRWMLEQSLDNLIAHFTL